jgi:zinc and cadmium transporter
LSPAFEAVVAALAVSAIALVGIVVTPASRWGERGETLLLSFAAGVLLATSFLELLPEAMQLAEEPRGPLAAALLGMTAFFFLERFLHGRHADGDPHPRGHHHHHADGPAPPSRTLVVIGDAVHNFIDGVVIAAAFLADTRLGVATTLAVATHEVPQEIADYAILVRGGLAPRRALLVNAASGLTALAGVAACFVFRDAIEPRLPWFLTATAGMFVYIAASDLIPELHHPRYRGQWIYGAPFLVGIALMAALSRWVG